MTERKLKYLTGFFLIGSHVGLLLFAIALFFLRGFNIDEFTTVVAVITPMLAGYTTSILAFIINEARILVDTSPRVNAAYAVLMILLPAVLVTILVVAVWLKANNLVFSNFEDFKRFLLLCESMFAAYVGMFVFSLFDKKKAIGIVGPTSDGRDSHKEHQRRSR